MILLGFCAGMLQEGVEECFMQITVDLGVDATFLILHG
jgi:hypothetical protein